MSAPDSCSSGGCALDRVLPALGQGRGTSPSSLSVQLPAPPKYLARARPPACHQRKEGSRFPAFCAPFLPGLLGDWRGGAPGRWRLKVNTRGRRSARTRTLSTRVALEGPSNSPFHAPLAFVPRALALDCTPCKASPFPIFEHIRLGEDPRWLKEGVGESVNEKIPTRGRQAPRDPEALGCLGLFPRRAS